MNSFSFEAIGTHWTIDLYGEISPQVRGYLFEQITHRIDIFEKSYSRFRADSYVNLTLSQPGEHVLPEDARPLLDIYEKLNRVTKGLFTPLIGKVLIDAGYDAEYSFHETALSSPPLLHQVWEYRYPKLTIKQSSILDFGACGKGYLIDLVSEMIRDQGIMAFCVDAGGDMRYEAKQPLRVGLENPLNTSQAIGILPIQNVSLCASAGSRRKWGRFHHIMNPISLTSPSSIIATWVLAADTITADALATCLFLVDPSVLLPHFSFDYLILHSNTTFQKSEGFRAELFLK